MDFGNESCIFLWRIEHFSMHGQTEFESPSFPDDKFSLFKMRICQKFSTAAAPVTLRFQSDKIKNIYWKLSLYNSNKSLNLTDDALFYNKIHSVKINQNIISEMMEKDTLSIRCQVWGKDAKIPNCFIAAAKSLVSCSKETRILTIENFSKLDKNSTSYIVGNLCPLELILRISDAAEPDDFIIIEVKHSHKSSIEVMIKISVLDTRLNYEICKESRSRFNPWENWIFPNFITRSRLMENQALYLPNNDLNLIIEMFIGYREMKCSEIVLSQEFPLQSPARSLHHDLKDFQKKDDLSDIKLECAEKTFYVHKFILSFRSPVFAAMFRSDMKENIEDVIQITDMEPDILEKLLSFVYTESFGSMKWEDVKKLYAVANKYQIVGLQKRCGFFLMFNTNVDKFPELIALGETHLDNRMIKYLNDLKLAYFR